MTALEHIRAKYPNAITDLPKGWRFLEFGEKICKNDRCYNDGVGPFNRVAYWDTGAKYRSFYYPMIRRERKKKIFDCLPGLTWPAAVKKEGAAKDLIYVGRGKEGGILGLGGYKVFSFGIERGEYINSSSSYVGNGTYYHYFVPKDHPMLAKYTLPKDKTKAQLTAENTTLLAENKALKERIAEFKKAAVEFLGFNPPNANIR